ncbi:NTP transferase domain-containing protein [Gryllotalpicola sp.]|uniref:NTP transferase domain-containing protein n=1 Tax=Gryllotalpicola sp. TaxID=1932787 RepID=UPI002636D012|nr:NTP transferase domain-containing protein [Gryllotalpicola sp.]
MTDANLAIVVLAAGQGTRMKSPVPKVLHVLAGRPLLDHVLGTAAELGASAVIVVVRHERDLVASAALQALPGAIIVDQDDLPGTGRAVELALAVLPAGFDGDVLILSGDVPLLDAGTLHGLLETHRDSGAAVTLLSMMATDPDGYGRIIRGAGGALARIVEQRDATEGEKAVREVNGGIYVFRARPLAAALARIGTDNAQGEKYLTDAIAVLRAAGLPASAVVVADAWRIEGVNDPDQLAAAEAAYFRHLAP